jgi:putative transposase
MTQEQKKERRTKFADPEKLLILKESEIIGVQATLEKYNLYPATFYYWKKKVNEGGEAAIRHSYSTDKILEITKLKKENNLLKQIIAEKELESKIKDELLLKKFGPWKK